MKPEKINELKLVKVSKLMQIGTSVCAGGIGIPSDEGRSQEGYIEKYLIEQVGKIVDNYKDILPYILITAGIEFLGKCLDNNIDIHQSGGSKKAFQKAISELFPSKYSQAYFKFNLYDQLRCGFNHCTLPGYNIVMSQRTQGQENLSVTPTGKLVLVIEDFYDDFKKACEQAKSLNPKFYLKPEMGSWSCSRSVDLIK